MGARTTARRCVRPTGMIRARRYAATTPGRRSPPSAGWISTGRQGVLDPVVLRPGIVYGGRRDFLARVARRGPRGLLLVLGSPTMRLPLVHVRDVAEAVVRALRLARAPAAPLDLVGPRPPTQAEWLARRRATGDERLVPLYLPVARRAAGAHGAARSRARARLPPRLGDAVGALRRRCSDPRARLAPGHPPRPGARATRRGRASPAASSRQKAGSSCHDRARHRSGLPAPGRAGAARLRAPVAGPRDMAAVPPAVDRRRGDRRGRRQLALGLADHRPQDGGFERAFADRLGVPDALALCSGTAALHLALRVLGIGPGDDVVVPTYTFTATAEAVVLARGAAGARRRRPGNVQPARRRSWNARSPRAPARSCRCTSPGLPCDMDPILDVRPRARARGGRGRGARAPGARPRPLGGHARRRRRVQLLRHQEPHHRRGRHAHAARSAGGGAGARAWRCTVISRDAWKRYTGAGSWRYEVVESGFKYNLTDMAASLGLVQLAKLEGLHAPAHPARDAVRRRACADRRGRTAAARARARRCTPGTST